jgi:translation initiation factor IF-1
VLIKPGTDHSISTVTQEALAQLRLELTLEELYCILPRTPGKLLKRARIAVGDLELRLNTCRAILGMKIIVLAETADDSCVAGVWVLLSEDIREALKSRCGARKGAETLRATHPIQDVRHE